MKRILIAICLFACATQAQNRVWSSPAYGKVDQREWMPQSIYTNCVMWMPMTANPASFSTWAVPSGQMRNNGEQGNVNARPLYSSQANGCLSFDGVDDYVAISNNASLNVFATSSFTLSGWCNLTTNKTNDGIVGKYDGNYGYIIYRTADKFRLLIKDGVSAPFITGNTVASTGVWYHVVGVRDVAGDVLRLYVNGASDQTALTDSTTGLFTNTVNAYIGNSGHASFLWPGCLDDIQIFNRALTSNEVLTIYNLGKPKHP